MIIIWCAHLLLCFPGYLFFHSNDLVNWKQIGHVLDRTSQLKVEDCGISAGVYAPAIRYNPNNDTFYMYNHSISVALEIWWIKTKNPENGWSDPIKLQFEGIDPSLFFDDNGKAYVVHNDAPAKANERYSGHRVHKNYGIMMWRMIKWFREQIGS